MINRFADLNLRNYLLQHISTLYTLHVIMKVLKYHFDVIVATSDRLVYLRSDPTELIKINYRTRYSYFDDDAKI